MLKVAPWLCYLRNILKNKLFGRMILIYNFLNQKIFIFKK